MIGNVSLWLYVVLQLTFIYFFGVVNMGLLWACVSFQNIMGLSFYYSVGLFESNQAFTFLFVFFNFYSTASLSRCSKISPQQSKLAKIILIFTSLDLTPCVTWMVPTFSPEVRHTPPSSIYDSTVSNCTKLCLFFK